MNAAAEHCLAHLRQHDPDRYLACLWLPAEWRGSVAALYAFNAEIARIPMLVSEPMPGEIRMQWWREVIDGERESGDNPLAVALIETIGRHDLPVSAFSACLDARQFDLYNDPMPDRSTFEGYAGETASTLLRLAALCGGAEADRALADACGHGGVAQTITAVLRMIAPHRRQRKCYLPGDMLAATGLDASVWLGAEPDARHVNAVSAMIAWARQHYRDGVAAVEALAPGIRPVFLPLAPLQSYLSAVERAGLRLFETTPDISPLRQQWIFWRAAMRGLPKP